MNKTEQFSRLRRIFFPVSAHEIARVVLLSTIMACLLFAYTAARIVKDGLFINAPGSSATAVPFIKLWVVLPISMLFVYIYSSLDKACTRRTMFVGLLGFFATFFLTYALFLYPYAEHLHMSQSRLAELQVDYPRYKHFIAIYANWTYSIFYAIADISGNILLTFAFWQLVNQITTSKADATRLYPIYGMYGNITGIISAGMLGRMLVYLLGDARTPALLEQAKHLAKMAPGPERAEVLALLAHMTRARIFAVATALCVALGLYLVLYHYLLEPSEREAPVQQKSKPKLSILQSFRLLLSSQYLFCIALITLCYGVSINLVEVTWKECVKAGSSNPQEFMEFFDNLYIGMGIVTFITGVLGTSITRRLGWLGQAAATPLMLFTTGIAFYTFTVFSSPYLLGTDSTKHLLAAMLGDPIVIAMYAGAIQNVLSKASKYTLFDPSTQMTYSVLPADIRTTGKAAVDVIGGRFGKSGGGLIQFILTTICVFDHQAQYVPMLMIMFTAICVVWLLAVTRLNTEYNTLSADQDKTQPSH